MRLAGLRTLAVFVAVLAFPFAASALITVGALDTPGEAWDVEVVDGLAYVADFHSGLRRALRAAVRKEVMSLERRRGSSMQDVSIEESDSRQQQHSPRTECGRTRHSACAY